ncbi:MAG: flagellar biosynthesis anti-sigma factor FlgM [Sphingomonadales bacterium]|nr:flagellar biosynthesis anti-sigma factor FlgM [Sphingomonadales bacterium]
MPSIEFGPKGLRAGLTAATVNAKDNHAAVQQRLPLGQRTAEPADAPPAVARNREFGPGLAPVDGDRVAEIRKAIEQGTYPIVPARVADAMIAAGLLLRNGK